MEQLLANILYMACTIFLVAISFSLIFWTAKFFHFAHAAIITAAAYACFFFSARVGAPIAVSAVLALVTGAGLGWGLEKIVYRPMRHRGTTPLILLLASLGLYIVLQNVFAAVFGDDTKMLGGPGIAPTFSIFGAKLTSIQLMAIGTAVMVLLGKIFVIDKTRVGLSLRAVADSPDLAQVSGIELDRTMGIAFCLGSFLAGTAGIFRALDVGITPTMGLPMLLMGVVAVVLGGNGKTLGVAIASLLLAFCQQLASWKFGTHWEEAVAFLLLLAFLLYRPQGILGKPLRKTTA